LAQLHTTAADAPDRELAPDEHVDVDPARQHLTARIRGREPDARVGLKPFERLARDEREGLARAGPRRRVVTVALQALAGDEARALHRDGRRFGGLADVDRFDVTLHGPRA